MAVTPDELLAFWFGEGGDAAAIAKRQEHLWWSGAPDVDEAIRARFPTLHDDAIGGRLQPWLATARGRLAAILVIDQFSRSLFRGTAAAFAHDGLARGWCLEGLALGADRALAPIERVFFYLPLEHSETLEDQERSVAVNEALAQEVAGDERELFTYIATFAVSHRDEIARFGRFPGRNAALGRASTAEELAFLRERGD